ncbi:MAG: hypothetical protein IKT29_07875 [Flavobacteriales bacterium]|nr:hypothetical protein [Flavobacteriales bacterium]
MKLRLFSLCIILLLTLLPLYTYAQSRSTVIENRLEAAFNIPLGKNDRHALSPSVRSVFSDHRDGDNIASFTGSQVELCYSYKPWSFMSFDADVEMDFTRGGETIFCAYVSAKPRYKYKRLSVYGEFKLSSNRRLTYHDHLTDPHLNYMAGMSIDAIKNVMTISAQCTIPHSLTENALEKYKIKLKLNLTLSDHIGLGLSHELVQDFKNTSRTHINTFSFGYSFL